MLLSDVRDFVATLGIAEDEHCYRGKMPDKTEKSIGAYNLKQKSPLSIPIGGMENRTYGTKGISFLVHWNRSQAETESVAAQLQKELIACKGVEINQHRIKFIQVSYSEPICVDTDDNGIWEYVIECVIYYEKGSETNARSSSNKKRRKSSKRNPV